MKSCNEESDERYFLEIDIKYHENLHKTQNGMSFLPERMKIEKVEKLGANLHIKLNKYSHTRFKASLKLWASVKKVHKMTQFNKKAWLKQYIDMNTDLRKTTKMILCKTFSS